MTNLICIVCPKGCHLKVDEQNGYTVTGNACERGSEYGKVELTNPTRVITSTVITTSPTMPRLPVKTDKPIPKGLIFEAMKTLDNLTLAAPVATGDIVVKNVCGTNANFVACRSINK